MPLQCHALSACFQLSLTSCPDLWPLTQCSPSLDYSPACFPGSSLLHSCLTSLTFHWTLVKGNHTLSKQNPPFPSGHSLDNRNNSEANYSLLNALTINLGSFPDQLLAYLTIQMSTIWSVASPSGLAHLFLQSPHHLVQSPLSFSPEFSYCQFTSVSSTHLQCFPHISLLLSPYFPESSLPESVPPPTSCLNSLTIDFFINRWCS